MPPRPIPSPSSRPLLRIPYTDALPPPKIIPESADTVEGAVDALVEFLARAWKPPASSGIARTGTQSGPRPHHLHPHPHTSSTSPLSNTPTPPPPALKKSGTLLLTGAGLSVSSGLADYRGTNGTYTLNRSYKPIFYAEFCASHEARKRYWARSFLGWPMMEKARPNRAHGAVRRLVEMGVVRGVVTQNVDSLHIHPSLSPSPSPPITPYIELHGALRTLTCLTCSTPHPRSSFQTTLSRLNPTWSTFLSTLQTSNALSTESPSERLARGLRTNPDGDVDVPGLKYEGVRYPACEVCVARAREGKGAGKGEVRVDRDGAWLPPIPSSSPSPTSPSTATISPGILKPSVIMFGESIPHSTKHAAEHAVDSAARMLVVGSSLATYSAWRLVKRAREQGMPVAVLNMGGVRGEEGIFEGLGEGEAVRCSLRAEEVLPGVVRVLEGRGDLS